MLEQNSGMRRLSMDWKCQFSVCFVLRRLWSIWVGVLVLETKQLPGLLRLCQESPTPRNPFVLIPHYFPTENYFTGEFPSSSTGNLFSVLTSLVLPGESWIPFWVNCLVLIPSCLDLCLVIPNYVWRRGLTVWIKASRFRVFLPILRAYKNFWSCPFRQRFSFPLSFPSLYN